MLVLAPKICLWRKTRALWHIFSAFRNGSNLHLASSFPNDVQQKLQREKNELKEFLILPFLLHTVRVILNMGDVGMLHSISGSMTSCNSEALRTFKTCEGRMSISFVRTKRSEQAV